MTGAFSLAQLVSGGAGIWVGRHIDAVGPRKVMTAASLVAVPGVATVALAPNLVVFYLGWVLTGVAMAGTLYPPAFAALTHWGGARRVRALTTLTLVAGLASTVFAPLASVLDDWLGWRQAYLVLLAGLVLVTVPLHWWGLDHPWRTTTTATTTAGSQARAAPTGSAPQVRVVARSAPFVVLMLANALTGLAVFAVIINLVPMLVEQGLSRNLAAVALGLGGVGQVAGRLGYARFAAATSVTSRGVIVLAAVAVSTAALAVAPSSPGLLIVLGMVLGLARGVYTLVQATAVTDRWGPAAYGSPQRHPHRPRPGRRGRRAVRRCRTRPPARVVRRCVPGPGRAGRRRRPPDAGHPPPRRLPISTCVNIDACRTPKQTASPAASPWLANPSVATRPPRSPPC